MVTVLGLGVIGGSLVRALRNRAPATTIVGWSPAIGERSAALDAGVLDAAPSAWEDAVEEADLVVLAMPLGACLGLLPQLEGIVSGRATIMDVASLKAPVERVAVEVGLGPVWVGAHPMAGSEGSGFGHSRRDLFDGARVWLVAGDAARDSGRLDAVASLWRTLGADPSEVDAGAHDRMMVLASHLPQLTSNALASVLAAGGVAATDLGPGGRDMTRLSASPTGMWLDLLRHAPEGLGSDVRAVARTLEQVAEALEGGRFDDIGALMNETRRWRGGTS